MKERVTIVYFWIWDDWWFGSFQALRTTRLVGVSRFRGGFLVGAPRWCRRTWWNRIGMTAKRRSIHGNGDDAAGCLIAEFHRGGNVEGSWRGNRLGRVHRTDTDCSKYRWLHNALRWIVHYRASCVIRLGWRHGFKIHLLEASKMMITKVITRRSRMMMHELWHWRRWSRCRWLFVRKSRIHQRWYSRQKSWRWSGGKKSLVSELSRNLVDERRTFPRGPAFRRSATAMSLWTWSSRSHRRTAPSPPVTLGTSTSMTLNTSTSMTLETSTSMTLARSASSTRSYSQFAAKSLPLVPI